MSYDRVRLMMGGEGVKSLTRTPARRETSAADYRGPSFDVYVEYDHRVDRRPTARTVLVRAPMPLLPADVEALVDRFGAPDAGADELSDGLHEGVAVWVDEPCGVVVTAYRPAPSWWAAEGGTTLQLETLDLARKGDSPASSSLSAILERKNGSPAAISDEASSMGTDLPAVPEIPPPVMEPVADPVVVSEVAPSPRPQERRPVPAAPTAMPVVPAVRAAPQTIATWHAEVSVHSARATAPKSNAPAVPQTIATWHAQVPAAVPPLRTLRGAATPPDRPAKRIKFVPPVYPPTARWLGKPGHVTLAIVVEADGTVATSPRIVAVRPTGRGFGEAAIDAVQRWRFSPAIQSGRPVESNLTIGVEFE